MSPAQGPRWIPRHNSPLLPNVRTYPHHEVQSSHRGGVSLALDALLMSGVERFVRAIVLCAPFGRMRMGEAELVESMRGDASLGVCRREPSLLSCSVGKGRAYCPPLLDIVARRPTAPLIHSGAYLWRVTLAECTYTYRGTGERLGACARRVCVVDVTLTQGGQG